MNKAYITVILILTIPVLAQAQDETWSTSFLDKKLEQNFAQAFSKGLYEDDLDCYLISDIWPEELWKLESELLLFEPFWEDIIELCDILLELDLDQEEITDEYTYGLFLEPWELDCELFWYEEW